MKPRTFANILGVDLQTSQTGMLASLFLWLVLTIVGWRLLGMDLGTAVLFGFLAMLIHWVNTFGHHLGHVLAARQVGYPMLSVRMWYLLATERFPKDEPSLPAEIHIKRALGGPIGSLCLTLIGLVFVWLLWPFGGLLFYLAVYFALENFLVYFIGALLPLGFTDGSTLLYWTRHKSAQ